MNKFIYEVPKHDNEQPVLFKVFIGNKGKYFVHKGKQLAASVDRFLDDVFRGTRGMKYPKEYELVVDYCNLFPAINRASIEVLVNGEPGMVLKEEERLLRSILKDDLCLNHRSIPPYKPNWMLKDVYKDKCIKCVISGTVEGKKLKFNFCPRCGRATANEPKSQ